MRARSSGRVRRTESEWRAIVRKFESSGLSQVAFCRKVGVSRQRFRTWRERLTAETTPGRLPATRKARSSPAAFVEWLAPNASEMPTVASSRGDRVDFELALPGGVVVRWRA
jgi:hypothetical protein